MTDEYKPELRPIGSNFCINIGRDVLIGCCPSCGAFGCDCQGGRLYNGKHSDTCTKEKQIVRSMTWGTVDIRSPHLQETDLKGMR